MDFIQKPREDVQYHNILIVLLLHYFSRYAYMGISRTHILAYKVIKVIGLVPFFALSAA